MWTKASEGLRPYFIGLYCSDSLRRHSRVFVSIRLVLCPRRVPRESYGARWCVILRPLVAEIANRRIRAISEAPNVRAPRNFRHALCRARAADHAQGCQELGVSFPRYGNRPPRAR